MAEQKKPSSAQEALRAEISAGSKPKTTPVLITDLPTEVQAALRRQLQYTAGPGEVSYPEQDPEKAPIKPLLQQSRRPGVNQPVSNLPVSNAARDMQILRDAGLSGRVVLDSPALHPSKTPIHGEMVRATPGASRHAFAIGADGAVTGTAWGNKDSKVVTKPLGGGPQQIAAWDQGLYDAQGQRAGVIRAAKTSVKVGPKMAARGMAILDVGPAVYQLIGQDIDTDFTVKMIPPQFRKPDETGKMREAVVIVNGQPFVQYEGEAFNIPIPGFENVGDEIATYFREHSREAMGKNKFGDDVAGTILEVRESEGQAMDKKIQGIMQKAARSTGPRKDGAPTFDGEYQVGRRSAEPKLPGLYDALREM